MNRNFRALAGLTAGAMILAAAASAVAEDHPAGPPSHEAWKARAHEHAETKIHALHDLLNIRPDQDAAFQALVTALHSPAGQERHDWKAEAGGAAALTTPQRLDRMAARMAERQSQFQARAAAIKSFYAVLSPEQQRAFDALPKLGVGRGVMGGHGGWGHEGMHGPQPSA